MAKSKRKSCGLGAVSTVHADRMKQVLTKLERAFPEEDPETIGCDLKKYRDMAATITHIAVHLESLLDAPLTAEDQEIVRRAGDIFERYQHAAEWTENNCKIERK